MTFGDLRKIHDILKEVEEETAADVKRIKSELESLESLEAPTDEAIGRMTQLYIGISEATRRRSSVSELLVAIDGVDV